MPKSVSAGQDRQSKGQRDSDETNTEIRKRGREYRTAAAA
jgi:hypothetical protein